MKLYVLLFLSLTCVAARTTRVFGQDQLQKAVRLDVRVRIEMDYLLYLPKEYETRDSWPLLLFLHGSGEKGNDLEKVKANGPPMLIASGKEFPMIIVSPQCPKEKFWEPLELIALLDELERKYNVDPDRIYLTGLSMGGLGAWRLATYIPNRLAAIAPICGNGELYWTKRFARVPVWAFHGGMDTPESLAHSQAMVDELKKNGGNPKFTIYPEAKHDAWTETYNNPEFYEWLLAQKRTPK